ncbi:MAG: hypothetical protein LBU82_02065 [Treponema sp.]|jgi:hypothetical protein|nr:hypothetical protein [Treponema sp.]
MKRLFFVLFLFCKIFLNGFSRENNIENTGQSSFFNESKQKNAIIIDLFPMIPGANGYKFGEGIGFGIMYERKINPYFSVLGGGTFATNFNDDISYGFSSRFRVYPLKTANRQLFTDVSLIYTGNITEDDNIQTLSGMFSVGWNFIFRNGLVLVPGIFYRHKFVDITGIKPYNLGFGFIIGIGWAF